LVFRDEIRVEGEPFWRERKNVLDGGFPSRDFEALAHCAVGQVGHKVGDPLIRVGREREDLGCRCR
jgi:hypothetical protein